jgi:hypothetical protein
LQTTSLGGWSGHLTRRTDERGRLVDKGLRMFSRVPALEQAEYGITVNTVAPGEIATPMTGQEDQLPQTLFVGGGLVLMGPQGAGSLGWSDWRTT